MKKRLAVLLSAVLALTMFGGQFAFAVSGDQFTDVKASDWFKADVDYVAENGYMIGTSDTTFEPQNNLTRAMFATILARYDGAEVDNSKPTIFTDVDVDQWFTGSIGWANEKQIVLGRGNNIFAPVDPITRQELAVMVERYITYVESTTDRVHVTPGVAIPFTDADQISDYAKESMDKAVIHGLIIGYPDKSVKPLQNITRAETAAVIHRIKWKDRNGRESYTVTLKVGGKETEKKEVPIGHPIELGKDIPVPEAPEGKTFTGYWWVTWPDGSRTKVENGSKIMLDGDITVEPIFEGKTPGGSGGSSVTSEKYQVVAQLSLKDRKQKNGDTLKDLKVDLQTPVYTVFNSEAQNGDKSIKEVMEALANDGAIETVVGEFYNDLTAVHEKTVEVGDDTYTVTIDADKKITAVSEKNGPVKNWKDQLEAEQTLYTIRTDDIADAAGITGNEDWDALVKAFAPMTLFTAAEDGSSLNFNDQAVYTEAVKAAFAKSGAIMDALGDQFDDSWDKVIEFLTDPTGMAVEPGTFTLDQKKLATAFSEKGTNGKGILKELGISGEGYQMVSVNETLDQDTLLKTINQRFSRAWEEEPDNVSAIVAFLKANMDDQDSKFFGKYSLTITVKKLS